MRFYFSEVDADLNLLETVTAIAAGIGVVVLPLVLKGILLWI